jgi:ribose transport system substrate-binding protein
VAAREFSADGIRLGFIGKEKDKVDAFVCLEAQSGKEVAGLLDRYNVTGKVVMAMDTDPETLDWIQKGKIAATIAQKPYTMAYVGMQMLDTLYHHKPPALASDWSKDIYAPVPSFVDTGSSLIEGRTWIPFCKREKV